MSDWAEPAGPPGPERLDPGDEPVEWVAEDGTVIEVVTRRQMRADGLRHRCTYVVVLVAPPDRLVGLDGPPRLDPADEIVIHLRADWKDVAPSHWDLAFGGVCAVGEDWERSARRELAEEAGIDLGPERPLIDLGSTRFDAPASSDGPRVAIAGRAYLAAWPHEPVSVDGEAVAFDRVPLGRLAHWLTTVPVCADSAAEVAPRLLALLNRS